MNIVNSRPLTFIPIEDEEDEALTPNHFIHGSSNGIKSAIPYEMDGFELRRKWKECQRLADKFWSRFVKEYLPEITRRSKWYKQVPPIEVGDLVLIIDERNRRNVYPRAIVLKTDVGSNGQVRRVQVQRADKFIMWRPASGLAKLDLIPKNSPILQNRPFSESVESLADDLQDCQKGGSVTNASFLNQSSNSVESKGKTN